MVEVGDRILVESEKVGTVTRRGVVTAVEDR
jgi:co-chaperonin GroES (HSP10)